MLYWAFHSHWQVLISCTVLEKLCLPAGISEESQPLVMKHLTKALRNRISLAVIVKLISQHEKVEYSWIAHFYVQYSRHCAHALSIKGVLGIL